jgi:hypothetical protein
MLSSPRRARVGFKFVKFTRMREHDRYIFNSVAQA